MEKRCYGCMKMKLESPICEHCGFNENVQNLPHQLPMGTVLRDQYLVGKVLGQGGFGITYLGWDLSLENPVAIKEYYPNGFVSRECTQSFSVTSGGGNADALFQHNRDRFLKEARTLAKLGRVPEIVRVHNLFTENNTAYFVMEYVQGIDLRRYINMRGGRLSVKETFTILRPVMEALSKVHEAGLVHRDISPDNIMLQPDGTAKLLDFGAVREVTDAEVEKNLSQSTEAILKHGFAPIEQYQRRGSLGPWTDIYALCATIYYCLTGQVPPDAPERVLGDSAIEWGSIPELTAQQAEALEKGMALLPKNRTGSVAELCKALFAQPAKPAEQKAPIVPEEKAIPVKQQESEKKPYPSQTLPLEEEAVTDYMAPIAEQKPYPVYTLPLEEEVTPDYAAPGKRKEPVRTMPVEQPQPKPEPKPRKKKPVWIVAIAAILAVMVLIGGGIAFNAANSKENAQLSSPVQEETSVQSAPETSVPATTAEVPVEQKVYKIGVAMYAYNDNFIKLYGQELEAYFDSLETDAARYEVTMVDGQNDATLQSGQIDDFIAQGVDAIICNLVRTSTADGIIDRVTAAGIPLVLINREPIGDNGDESYPGIINNPEVCYVGVDRGQPGTYQGEIVRDLPNHGDMDGDGVVSYVMIMGDPENPDGQARAKYAVKALTDAGISVKELVNQSGYWDQSRANQIAASALKQYGKKVDVIFCGNDGMALGAADAIEAAGRKVGEDILLLGIDAMVECVEMVDEGTMTGTVLNDYVGQAHTAADAAIKMLNGEEVEDYYWVDHVKIDQASLHPFGDEVEDSLAEMMWKNNVLMQSPHKKYVGIEKEEISSVTFLDTLANAPGSAWDVSEAQNRSVLAWAEENGDYYDLYIAGEGGINAVNACSDLFTLSTNLEEINFNDCFHTEDATNMGSMFSGCKRLTTLDVSGLDTSNVTDMSYMFSGCRRLTTLDVSGWNTCNVTDMDWMFYGCSSLTTLDVSGLDTSNVTNMRRMFSGCSSLTTLDVSGFDTSNVTNMYSMFLGCRELTTLDVSGWDTSNVQGYADFMDKGKQLNGRPWEELFEK